MEKAKFEQWKNENKHLTDAIRDSAWALHEGVNQHYDGDKPYGVHLDMVAQSVLEYAYLVCDSEDDLIPLIFSAYYHDSIEDARLTYNDVVKTARKWMDEKQAYLAAEIVYALTNDKGRTRAERAGERYYNGIRNTPYAPLVKLADRLANTFYSCGAQGQQGQHMCQQYRKEWPHFFEAISTHSDDKRFALPQEMIDCILSL